MITNEYKIWCMKTRKEVLELMRHAIRLGDTDYAKELGDSSIKLKKT